MESNPHDRFARRAFADLDVWWSEGLGQAGRTGPTHALTALYHMYILVHMKTTLNIDDELLARAAELTGTREKTALVRRGLEALIALESSRRLARLGGTEKKLAAPRRRRPRSA